MLWNGSGKPIQHVISFSDFTLHIGIDMLMTLFPCLAGKDSANEFLKYLNGRHNSIKFTIEFEQAEQI